MSTNRTIVIGAGLSGLACAFDLVRAGLDVIVLEATDRPGGVVGTLAIDEFRFERGPNTVQAGSVEFRRLCADLGLADRLIAAAPEARERYLFHAGRLHALPGSLAALMRTRLLSLGEKLHLATEPLRSWTPPPDDAPEPDLGAFLSERLGRGPAHRIGGAFVRGVYAAELEELGAKSAFPRLWQLAAEHGGLVRGLLSLRRQAPHDLPGPKVSRMSLLSFPSGLQEIVDALAAALAERIHLDAAVASIERAGEGWRATLASGRAFDADRVVVAVPAPAAVRLLAPIAPATVPIAHLTAIRHARVVLVHLGFDEDELPRWRSGFGYLVPPSGTGAAPRGSDPPRPLGTIFVSNLFPGRAPGGDRAVSSFYPGAFVERFERGVLVDQACRDLALALGEARPPRARVAHVERFDDVIPRYGPGHATRIAELLARIQTDLPGLDLAGSYVAGVSVEQVIARGRAVARAILDARAVPQTTEVQGRR